jgi:hypothetical protein
MPSLSVLTGFVPPDDPLRFLAPPKGSPPIPLADILNGYVGMDVQILAYHLPSEQIQLNRIGGGSCFWPPGACPYHSVNPASMFSFKGQGVLATVSEAAWRIGNLGEPFTFDELRGHSAGLVTLPVDVQSVNPADFQRLVGQMKGLQSVLGQVRNHRKQG